MDIFQRRRMIIDRLSDSNYEKIDNLSELLGVSKRTIRRDIEALSAHMPIYTKQGRHGGGVYLMKGYTPDRLYMKNYELDLLKKLIDQAKYPQSCSLTEDEIQILMNIILNYTPP